MNVVINTPTGKIGSAVITRLLDTDVELVLLTRSPEKIEALAGPGVTIHAGNLENEEFVVKATSGADLLFWVTPADVATKDLRAYYNQLGRIAVKAVTDNAIPRVVDLSSIGAQHESGTGPIAGLHDVEKMLEKTDAHVTHLRPAFFMENFFMSVGTIAEHGSMYLPCQGSTSLEMIATADIAQAAAETILDSAWTGRNVIELSGPSKISFEEAAEKLESALGTQVLHVPVTPDQTREALIGMGIDAGVADTYNEMYSAFDSGIIMPEDPERLKRMETSFDTFAEQVFRPIIQSIKKA